MGAIQQRYVSKDLTHFVGRSKKTEEEQYEVLLQIVRSGELRSDPSYPAGTRGISGRTMFGPRSRFSMRETYDFPGVCFCDIPLADLEIHTRKYSNFGIAFQKVFLLKKGASPVFYIAKDSVINPAQNDDLAIEHRAHTRAEFFDKMFPAFNGLCNGLAMNARTVLGGHGHAVDQLAKQAVEIAEWSTYITEYVLSYCVPFSAGLDDAHEDHFYMEREWRVFGDVQFAVDDVERIMIPRSFGKRIKDDLPGFFGQTYFI